MLTALRLPLPWDEFTLPNPLRLGATVLLTGEPAWAWSGAAPDLGIPGCEAAAGDGVPGWDLDHVVLLVPDLAAALDAFDAVGVAPRLQATVGGRKVAHLRVGPVLEVFESPVRNPAIYGVALVTEEPLEVLALRWRALGREVTDPRPSRQPGRRVVTVGAVEAGLAVLSPDRPAPSPTHR